MKKKALDTFKNNYNCAQAVLSAYGTKNNIDTEYLKSLSCAFGAGIAGEQQICGAVSGALMAIGHKYFDNNDHINSKATVYKKSTEFMASFSNKFESVICKDILGMTLDEARKKDMFKTKCKDCVETACEILEKIQ